VAGDWIKIEHVTIDKPEVDQMANILSIDHDAVVGKCLRFWIWADQQTEDGNAVSVTKTFLDRLVFCPGFAAALAKVGWLNGRDGHYSIPNFGQHNGQSAKKRANTSKRVKKKRNADSVTKALPEKRREEKRLSVSVCSKARDLEIPKSLDEKAFRDTWNLYCDWWLAQTDVDLDSIKGKFQLDGLASAGLSKAIADLRLTMEKSRKPGSIWDSSRTFGTTTKTNGAKTFQQMGRETTANAVADFLSDRKAGG
jgi:hypothetical protein